MSSNYAYFENLFLKGRTCSPINATSSPYISSGKGKT